MYNRLCKAGLIIGMAVMTSGCSIRTDITMETTTVAVMNNTEVTIVDSTKSEVKVSEETNTVVSKEEETLGEVTNTEAEILQQSELSYEKSEFIEYLEANNIVYGKGAYADEIIVTSQRDDEGNWHEYLYRLNEDSCQWELMNEIAICEDINEVHRKYGDGIKAIIVSVTREEDIAIIVDYGNIGKLFAITADYGKTLEFCEFPDGMNEEYSEITAFYYNNGVMLLGNNGANYSQGNYLYRSYDKGKTWESVELNLGDIMANGVRPVGFVEYNERVLCYLEITTYNLNDTSLYVEIPMKETQVDLSYVSIPPLIGEEKSTWSNGDFTFNYYEENRMVIADISWQGRSCQVEWDNVLNGSICILEEPIDFDGDGQLETLMYYQVGARGSRVPYVIDIYNGELRCYKYEVPEIEYKVLNDYRIWYTSEGMEYPGIIDLSKDEYYIENWWNENGNLIAGKQYDVWPYTTYDIEFYLNEDNTYTIAFGTDMCVESGAGASKVLYSYYKVEDGELKLIERK